MKAETSILFQYAQYSSPADLLLQLFYIYISNPNYKIICMSIDFFVQPCVKNNPSLGTHHSVNERLIKKAKHTLHRGRDTVVGELFKESIMFENLVYIPIQC